MVMNTSDRNTIIIMILLIVAVIVWFWATTIRTLPPGEVIVL